ncbi:DUF6574 domain-containing protein [Alkalibacillus salilacus]|uniref:Cation transport ATPase n=1 Tax=Alkalibacillus salilacus TaxID=284582 RepID=A0ABT9VHQ8_9BACI|nr:DUF6574 domain-containing protein [Alkalibacillus salilacus]MDQ0160494.1 cation transport ATPase [Alkalibacillus salilacus]
MANLICQNCNHQQDDGKFCENCGSPLATQTSESQQTYEQPAQTHQAQPQPEYQQPVHNQAAATTATATATGPSKGDQAKSFAKDFWNYLTSTVKKPDLALKQDESTMWHSILTLVLIPIFLSLGVYFLANTFYQNMYGDMMAGFEGASSESLPFFQLVSRLAFGFILVLLSGLISTFIALKIGKVEMSIQATVSQYGAFAVPFLFLSALTIITGLSTSIQFTSILLVATLFPFIFVAPAVITTYNINKFNENQPLVYASIASFFMTAIILYILFSIYLENLIYNLENVLGGF